MLRGLLYNPRYVATNMSGDITVDDPAFDRLVTLRDAYRIMEHFVAAHVERGEVDTGQFHSYFALASDRRGLDPAALYDYLDSVAAVLGPGEAAGKSSAPSGAPAA
jgi:hypothetical protein